jgi:hypothetical protein
MKAKLVKKSIVDRVVTEIRETIEFIGVPLQPMEAQYYDLAELGARNWQHYRLFCSYDFENEDIIEMEGKTLRIVKKSNWNTGGSYGYFQYDLVEDYERTFDYP